MRSGESSRTIRERVVAARRIQQERYRSCGRVTTNAEAKSRDLQDICRLSTEASEKLQREVSRLSLSARAYDRVLKVARTIADLAGREDVTWEDVSEASGYRALDRSFWS